MSVADFTNYQIIQAERGVVCCLYTLQQVVYKDPAAQLINENRQLVHGFICRLGYPNFCKCNPSQIGFSGGEIYALGLTSSHYTSTVCQALKGVGHVSLQMSPVKIDGAKRQLFSLAKSHNVKLQEAALKRRKSPSPDVNPINAQTPAAEEAAEEAGAAHPVKDEEEQQAAEIGKKTKALKKEKSMDEKAAQGIGKARLVKRKRKDDAEPKVLQVHQNARLAMRDQSCMCCHLLFICFCFQTLQVAGW